MNLLFRYVKSPAILALAGILLVMSVSPVQAQSINVSAGEGDLSAGLIQFIGLVTVLSVAPGLLLMVTSFTRIVIVLSFLRSALGLQQSPPNMVLVSLALILTFFVMTPVFDRAWTEGVQPLVDKQITEEMAAERIVEPFYDFMLANVRPKDLELFTELASKRPEQETTWLGMSFTKDEKEGPGLGALVAGFMFSELHRAFEIGFLLFLPFLIIDMVVAAVLMSMGVMMLPPMIVSLPFKIVFFVLIDGWYLIAGSLTRSFAGV